MFYIKYMKISADIILLLSFLITTVTSILIGLTAQRKKITKRKENKIYKVSLRKYRRFQKISSRTIKNKTIAVKKNSDRGIAGYENVVVKGVDLLKREGFRVPSLEVNYYAIRQK